MITSIIALSAAAVAARRHAVASTDDSTPATSTPPRPEQQKKSRRSAVRPVAPPFLQRIKTRETRRSTTEGSGHSDWDRDAWGHIIVCSTLSPSSVLSPSVVRAKSHPRDKEARGTRKLSAPPSFFDCTDDASPRAVTAKAGTTFIELKEVGRRVEKSGRGGTAQEEMQDDLPVMGDTNRSLGGSSYTPLCTGRCVQRHF